MSIKANHNNTAMLYYDSTGKSYDICIYFNLTKIIKKIPENSQPEEVEIFIQSNTFSDSFRIPITSLSDSKTLIADCTKHYLVILPSYISAVQGEMLKQLRTLINNQTFSYESQIVGGYNYNNKYYFIFDKITFDDNKECVCTRDIGNLTSGSETIYDDLLNNYVFNNYNLSLAYTLGFSGVLIDRISSLRDLGVVLVGLSGQSTSGKTTAIKLATSIWANNNDVQSRIIMRSDTSQIGFNAQFAGFYGIPIIFDDVDQNSSINISDTLNRLSRGTQRVVCNQNGEAQYNRLGFGGICIFVSECSLLEKTRKETGLYNRFIDLQDVVWTTDSKSAETIKNITSQNYGFKGKKYIEFFQTKTEEELLKIYDESYEFIDSIMSVRDKFTDRAIKKYAAIIATAKLLNECFNINLNIKEMSKILIINENINKEDRDKATLTYNYIKEYFLLNLSNFNLISKNKSNPSNHSMSKPTVGYAVYTNNILHLYISTKQTDTLLRKAGYNQLSNYKKEWKAREYTRCEKDRYDAATTKLIPTRHFHFEYNDFDGVIQRFISTFDIDKNNPSLYTDENLINEFLNEDEVDVKIKPEIPYIDFKVDDEEAINNLFKED